MTEPGRSAVPMRPAIGFIGQGLERPESLVARRSGGLAASCGGVGVSLIDLDGNTARIAALAPPTGFLVNGIAEARDGSFLIANLGDTGGVWRLERNGTLRAAVTTADGAPLPPVNFVAVDSQDRVWLTVSTRARPRWRAFRPDRSDGFIAVAAPGSMDSCIVADALSWTNELIVDERHGWLYVNESTARRTTRFVASPDGRLGDRRTVAQFGSGTFPDGLTLSPTGDLWVASPVTNRLFRLGGGIVELVVEQADAALTEAIETAFATGRFEPELLEGGRQLPLANISSVAFCPGQTTAFLGSLHGSRVATVALGAQLPTHGCAAGG